MWLATTKIKLKGGRVGADANKDADTVRIYSKKKMGWLTHVCKGSQSIFVAICAR